MRTIGSLPVAFGGLPCDLATSNSCRVVSCPARLRLSSPLAVRVCNIDTLSMLCKRGGGSWPACRCNASQGY